MFLVAAIMQGVLLFMCICWKVRQRRLRIDDFGRPLRNSPLPELPSADGDGLDDGESVEENMEDDSLEEDIVSITPEEAEQAALLGRRKKRKIRRRRWWTKWIGTK
jgi:hypothetical protein